MDGIQELWIRVEHKPRDAGFQLFNVTYTWIEHRRNGDVHRSHTERIAKLPHQYMINTAGQRDPTMECVPEPAWP